MERNDSLIHQMHYDFRTVTNVKDSEKRNVSRSRDVSTLKWYGMEVPN